MNSIIKLIDPKTAQEMLETSKGNYRKISNSKRVKDTVVARYAEEMKKGEWQLTPQGIVFDEDGCLIDGHHRLNAVILSGVSVNFYVTYNVPRKSVEVLDCGLPRVPYIVLQNTRGIPAAAASKRGWSLTRLHFAHIYGINKMQTIPTSEYKNFIQNNSDLIVKAIHCAEHESKRVRLTVNAPCFCAAFYALQAGVDYETIEKFFIIATTGFYENNSETSAIVFRNMLLEQKKRGAGLLDSLRMCAYAQTALKDFVNQIPRTKKYQKVTPFYTNEVLKESVNFFNDISGIHIEDKEVGLDVP